MGDLLEKKPSNGSVKAKRKLFWNLVVGEILTEESETWSLS